MNTQRILQAWSILENVTPLSSDCGQFCSAACCAPDEDGQGGVFLFPGEYELLGDADWATLQTTEALGGTHILTCKGHCPRDRRPLGCRIFPLTPIRLKSLEWGVRIDRRSFAMCPLAESGTKGLKPEFIEAVGKVISLIAEDEEGQKFLKSWAKLERAYGEGL